MRQRELIRNAKFTVTSTTALRNPDESQRLRLPQRWGNGIAVNTEVLEILERYRQPAVFPAAMVGMLDLNAREDVMPR